MSAQESGSRSIPPPSVLLVEIEHGSCPWAHGRTDASNAEGDRRAVGRESDCDAYALDPRILGVEMFGGPHRQAVSGRVHGCIDTGGADGVATWSQSASSEACQYLRAGTFTRCDGQREHVCRSVPSSSESSTHGTRGDYRIVCAEGHGLSVRGGTPQRLPAR